MFMKAAKELCPELIVLPYNFPLYEQLSEKLYSVLYSSQALMVEPVSVDEAYLEFPAGVDGLDIATKLCAQIFEATGGCHASAGVGSNKLLARLATKRAKPNGQYSLLSPEPDVGTRCSRESAAAASSGAAKEPINVFSPTQSSDGGLPEEDALPTRNHVKGTL